MRGLEHYTARMGPGFSQRVLRLVLVDGHQVAWVAYRHIVDEHEHSGAHLLCDCDLARVRNDRPAIIGRQGQDPNVCRYRAAAKLLRCLELRADILDPHDPYDEAVPERLIEIVQRGHAGEWVGQDSSDTLWLGQIAAIFDAPEHYLRAIADDLFRAKRLGLSGTMVSPWTERFAPRDDRDQHLDDTSPPSAPPVTGTLELYSETGTEGGYWALQRDDQPGYPGLHVLRTGDWLQILEPDGTTVWQGYIRLRHYPLFTEDAHGYWIHADQRGLDRNTWARWFIDHHRARLVPAKAGQ